jgi:hypothetical protein
MVEIWTPEKRLSYLPDFPRNLFITDAEFLYGELMDNKLKVVLSPAPSPQHADHKIRIAQSHNPEWYSSIYYSHNRRGRKFLKNSLWRIVNGMDGDFDSIGSGHYVYDTLFREMIYSRLVEGYCDKDGSRIFPNNKVRNFFGLESVMEEEFVVLHKKQLDELPF